MPAVSIVIRSFNDASIIRKTITHILNQSFSDYEILNLDNESSDGTAEIIREYKLIKQITIPRNSYVPGVVLNKGIAASQGEIVLFNNSDSIPQNNNWLKNLISPILSGSAAATYARQIPRPEAYPWIKRDYARGFGSIPLSKDFFSAVSFAADRNILLKYPFDSQIRYSEDVLWAKTIRQKGFKITYVPDAITEHSHNYTPEQVYKRFYGEGYADGEILQSGQNILSLLKSITGGIYRDILLLINHQELQQLIPCLKYRINQKTSYYRGRNTYWKKQK